MSNNIHRFRTWIAEQEWTFAKTYAETAPHEYIVRTELSDDDVEIFVDFVQYIRDNGVVERFYGRQYTYLYLDGYKYWTMGNPVSETTVLNRENLSGYET